MTRRLRSRVTCLIIAVAIGLTGRAAESALVFPVGLSFLRLATSGGGATFELRANGVGRYTHLTSPGGTAFASLSALKSYASFDEAAADMFGTWTIEELSPPETLHFDLDPQVAAAFFLVAPTITSPSENDLVPRTPHVTWEWPTGVAIPSERAYRVDSFRSGISSGLAFGGFPFSSDQADVDLYNPVSTPPTNVRIRIGTFQNLDAFASPAYPGPSSPFDLTRFTFYNFSEAVNLRTVAPEPATLTLAGVLLFAVSRGRKIG